MTGKGSTGGATWRVKYLVVLLVIGEALAKAFDAEEGEPSGPWPTPEVQPRRPKDIWPSAPAMLADLFPKLQRPPA